MSATTTVVPGTALYTRAEHRALLEAVMTEANRVVRQYGWCSESVPFLAALSPYYRTTGEGRGSGIANSGVEIDLPDDGARLQKEWFTEEGWANLAARDSAPLAEDRINLRRRILGMTRGAPGSYSSYRISLADANSVLRAAGLEEWHPEAPESRRHRVFIDGPRYYYFDTELPTEEVETRVREFVESLGTNLDMRGYGIYARDVDGQTEPQVPASETMPLARR